VEPPPASEAATTKYETPEIFVDDEIREKAVKPILRMLEISEKLGL